MRNFVLVGFPTWYVYKTYLKPAPYGTPSGLRLYSHIHGYSSIHTSIVLRSQHAHTLYTDHTVSQSSTCRVEASCRVVSINTHTTGSADCLFLRHVSGVPQAPVAKHIGVGTQPQPQKNRERETRMPSLYIPSHAWRRGRLLCSTHRFSSSAMSALFEHPATLEPENSGADTKQQRHHNCDHPHILPPHGAAQPGRILLESSRIRGEGI